MYLEPLLVDLTLVLVHREVMFNSSCRILESFTATKLTNMWFFICARRVGSKISWEERRENVLARFVNFER